MNSKIGIIGAGNMGRTFYKGLVKLFSEENVFICDKNQEKLDALKTKNTFTNPNDMLKEVVVVIVAVKPQSLNELMKEVSVALSDKLIISIMAGITLERLKEMTNVTRIIRAMPNLPVQVNKGVTGWVVTAEVEDGDTQLAKKIFSALGKETQVSHESMLDAITVLSGCGPAYFYYLTEFLADKARSMGFTDEEASSIAENTLIGSTELLKKNDKTAREWRQAVMSKGGVTEVILNHLNNEGFSEMFNRAIDEGLKRNEELNS